MFEQVASVVHGRRHYVLSTGPLAEIDQATPLAAEREVFDSDTHWLLTRRALHLDFALAWHTSIVVEERIWHQPGALSNNPLSRLAHRPWLTLRLLFQAALQIEPSYPYALILTAIEAGAGYAFSSRITDS